MYLLDKISALPVQVVGFFKRPLAANQTSSDSYWEKFREISCFQMKKALPYAICSETNLKTADKIKARNLRRKLVIWLHYDV